MPDTLPAPLGGSPPAEVSLPHAPLVRVVAQVRFPGILKIDDRSSLVPFQEEIRGTYPLFQQEASQQLHVEMGPNGPNVRQGVSNVWRFADPEQAWRLSLTTDMIALETSRYTSRADFLARWTRILAAVERAFNPQIALRVGLRYVDRVTGDALSTIQDMVRKDVLGVAMPELREHVRHALSEAMLAIEEGEMLLRWGILPPGATVDPGAVEPIASPSWILDIDAFSSEQRSFVHQDLGASFRALAERAYSVFRFMITDAFLQTYGGTP